MGRPALNLFFEKWVAVYGLKLEIGKWKFVRDNPCFASGYAGQAQASPLATPGKAQAQP